MISIPSKMLPELNGRMQTHKVNIAACNVYFQTVRMLNGRHEILDRDTYKELFLNALSDIELITPPTDAFIPGDGPNDKLFVVNRLAAEYLKITERLPLTLLNETLPATSAMMILINKDATKLDDFYDDVFIYYNLFKYLDQIDMIRLNTFSNSTTLIEWIVNNVTLDQWKDYIKTNKINVDKYAEACEDLLFNPDISVTERFYLNEDNSNPKVPVFDMINLMQRLCTNMVIKSDIHLVLGAYLIMSFAMMDFMNDKVSESPCAQYVIDVLSKL